MSDGVELGIDIKAHEDSINAIGKSFEKVMRAAQLSATKQGFLAGLSDSKIKSKFTDLGNTFASQIQTAGSDAISKINALETKLRADLTRATSDSEKQGIRDKYNLQIEEIKKSFKFQQQAIESSVKTEFKLRSKEYEKLNKEFEESLDQASQGFLKNAQQASQHIKGAFGSLKNLDAQGFASSLKGLITQGGKNVQGRLLKAKSKALAGGNAKQAAMFGKMAARMGPMIAGVGALVVGVGALIALMMKAFDSQQKMNKAILEQASAMEIAAGAGDPFMGLTKGLREIRQAATDMDMVFMGIKDKDVFEFIGALGNANMTMQEFNSEAKDSADRVKNLKDTMMMTTGVARMLGVKASELAGNLATLSEEQGGSLRFQAEQMTQLAKTAQQSGFQQKYFYQTVLESVSGMALYNKRVAEAGNLLVQLGKVLGSKMAADTVKELSQGFKSEGIAESYKRVLKTGQANTQKIFKKEAQVASQQFLTNLGSSKEALAKTLGDMGVDIKFGDNAEENADLLARKMGSLTKSQQEKLVGELIANGDLSRDQIRQIGNLVDLGKAAKGDRVAMAAAMDELGPGGVLQMQLKSVQGILGTTKKIHEMTSFEELKVLEDVGGFSREQIERLQEISLQATGQFNKLQELKLQGDLASMDRITQIKRFGAFIDENGKTISARLDDTGLAIDEASQRQVTSAEELVALQMAYDEKQLKPSMDEATYWATEQAMATVTLSDIMEGAILKVLEEIANMLVPIVSWVTGGLTEKEREGKQEALTQIQEESKAAREKEIALRKAIKEQEKIIATQTGSKREKAIEKKKQLEMQSRMAQNRTQGLERERKAIHGMNYRDTSFMGLELGGKENAIARKRLDSGDDFRNVARGGGEHTGMTFGEKALLTTLVATTTVASGGTAAPMWATAGGGLAYGMASTGVVDSIAEHGFSDPNTQAIVDTLEGPAKEMFDTMKGGGFTDKEVLDALYGQENKAAEYYAKQKMAEEKALEEQKKHKDILEDIRDSSEDRDAGIGFASSSVGQNLGYTGGTDNASLIALGKAAKADSSIDKARMKQYLEMSGFDAGQKETILGAMNDGAISISKGGKVFKSTFASQDDVKVLAGREGGPLQNAFGGNARGGNSVFNFYGGSTAEIIAHIDKLVAQGVIS